jgi:hypothetical protein
MTDGSFGETIFAYTRAQAIADGVLVDVSELAREAGFTVPVAMTLAAWSDLVEWDPFNPIPQDETGRLWDVLMVTRHAIRGATPRDNRLKVQVLRVKAPGPETPTLATFYAHSGPGDEGEHVITLLLPGED